MGAGDKEAIVGRFGPLWSGRDRLLVGGVLRTLLEVKRVFDLDSPDIVAIDLHELADGRFAFRFYDGDDRRIVVFVFDGGWEILEELRAHVAEWLGALYYDAGALAFDPEAMAHFLRKGEEEKDR
jgi:hypothetical protein